MKQTENKTSVDLDFKMLSYGTHEWPWSFEILTRPGGAATPRNLYPEFLKNTEDSTKIHARLPYVRLLHEQIMNDHARGLRQLTIITRIRSVIAFYSWADTVGVDITYENSEIAFRDWTEHLVHRVQIKKDILQMTAYRTAKAIDLLIARIKNVQKGPIHRSRLSAASVNKRVLGTKADKQNLEELFEFGKLLKLLSDNLDYESIIKPLPLIIKIDDEIMLEEWSGFPKPIGPRPEESTTQGKYRYRYRSKRIEYDPTLNTRQPLVNLRIEVELLIFVSQTGLNFSQAYRLKRGKFRFKTASDDYEVYRTYKGRKQGEAEFRIFKGYRSIFQRYLEWLEKICPSEEDRLFPFSSKHQIPSIHTPPSFHAIKHRCNLLGIKYIPPITLRNARVNWLLRISRDPELSAEMSQHTTEVLIQIYEKPHHQSAASEISYFHRSMEELSEPPSPGGCAASSGRFQQNQQEHNDAPKADCINAAGCFFCEHHRDIDSFDYVWSLLTYRSLKVREIERDRSPKIAHHEHPTKLVIDRVTQRLKVFEASSDKRSIWVKEAEARMREERYHPMFGGLIELMELNFG